MKIYLVFYIVQVMSWRIFIGIGKKFINFYFLGPEGEPKRDRDRNNLSEEKGRGLLFASGPCLILNVYDTLIPQKNGAVILCHGCPRYMIRD